jgi:hypothetical protein
VLTIRRSKTASNGPYAYGEHGFEPAAVWTRLRFALIAGEPLDRALLIADSANGTSRELPMNEWMFVPPSLPLSLALKRHRYSPVRLT